MKLNKVHEIIPDQMAKYKTIFLQSPYSFWEILGVDELESEVSQTCLPYFLAKFSPHMRHGKSSNFDINADLVVGILFGSKFLAILFPLFWCLSRMPCTQQLLSSKTRVANHVGDIPRQV